MNETIKSTSAAELERKADKLEAILGQLHGSAYAPVILAARLFKRLAKQSTPGERVEADSFSTVIADLRKFSNTVANPASARMVDAAETLEQLQASKP